MAIRRPPTTFSDTISTADIADDAITGGKLANDIAISTTGNIATTGSGTLTVAGNTTLSGTNNLGSNPTVTLGSNATFPDGMVINEKVLYTRKDTSSIVTASGNNSFVSTGIDGTFVTKASSTDADMLFIIFSGMMHSQGTIAGETAICLTTSSNTTHSNSNDLLGGSQYKNYFRNENGYNPTEMVFYNHEVSYSAGDTLHWRVFFKKNTTDGNNFYLYHSGSTMCIIMKEVLK